MYQRSAVRIAAIAAGVQISHVTPNTIKVTLACNVQSRAKVWSPRHQQKKNKISSSTAPPCGITSIHGTGRTRALRRRHFILAGVFRLRRKTFFAA